MVGQRGVWPVAEATKQRMSAEAPRSHLKHADARSSIHKSFARQHLRRQARALATARTMADQQPLRPERSDTDSQGVDAQGVTTSQNSSCPQSCPNCRQSVPAQDNSGQNVAVILQSLLRATQEPESRADTNGECPGNTLLETIRLLTKLSPAERAALVGLLKALEA